MNNFRRLIRKLGPRWLLADGDESEKVSWSLALLLDAFAERARQAVTVRFPSYAPDDALPPMGRDRRIVRGVNEPAAHYAARLLTWIDDWKTAGSPFALHQQLRGFLGADVRIRTVDTRGNWFTTDVGGARSYLLDQGNWTWDGEPATKWSRFWVIIYATGLWSPSPYDWGDAAGSDWGEDDGTTWGSTASIDEVVGVRGIVKEWKPAGTRCVNIIVAFDDESFDPTSSADGMVQLVTGESFNGLAIDTSYIYWGDATGGRIRRSKLDGTGAVDLVTGAGTSIIGVAVDASYVYWCNYGTGAADGTISRAPIGGGAATVLVSGETALADLAVDASHIYWLDDVNNLIRRSELDGTNKATLITVGTPSTEGICVDSTYIYWAGFEAGTIGRAKLDGTGAVDLVTGEASPVDVTVDATHVYWTAQDGSTVRRATLDGNDIQTLRYSVPTVVDIAVSGSVVYWDTYGPSALWRAEKIAMPDGTWDKVYKNVGGRATPNRLDTARYWNGTG